MDNGEYKHCLGKELRRIMNAAGNRGVMDYLQGLGAPMHREDDRTMEFLYAASRGDTDKLRHVRAHARAPFLITLDPFL